MGEAMNQILEFTKYVHPDQRLDVVPSDPDDNRVLEYTLKADSDTIVTGDTDLLVIPMAVSRFSARLIFDVTATIDRALNSTDADDSYRVCAGGNLGSS